MLPNFSLKLKQISIVQYLQTDLLKDLFIEFSNKIGNYHEKNIKKKTKLYVYMYIYMYVKQIQIVLYYFMAEEK